MTAAKNIALTTLRNKTSSRIAFRTAANQLFHILAHETIDKLEITQRPVATPLGTATGSYLERNIVLVPILRSGITMVSVFLNYFEQATIGVVGIKRDEKTAEPQFYYENFPPLTPDHDAIVLDPMIATGGTGTTTLKLIVDKGIPEKNIIYVAVVSAPEGLEKIRAAYPGITIIVAAEDQKLSTEKFIIPGIGDFGDRFFGTTG